MHVPNTARRSVVFLGDKTDEGVFRPRATAFLVGVPSETQPSLWFSYLVTAAHVVERCQRLGTQMWGRVNLRAGGASVIQMTGDWRFHPDLANETTDVAATRIGAVWDSIDHDPIPLPERQTQPITAEQRDIGLGDETFMIGLFRNHAGQDRNIPIVRIGNVAAMPEELVSTRIGNIRAYLVEMRSIGGLSGSPVFVNRPPEQPPFGFLRDPRFKPPDPEQVNWFRYHFLGLVHGHFDVRSPDEDIVQEDDGGQGGGINSGIGIVIPAQKIIETLYQPDLVDERRRDEAEYDK
jgi:hypothetical protein